jgi:DNA modification methylase
MDGNDKGSERSVVRVHPTQKPVELMEWCLSFTPAGCIVLDPYAGSGTTGVACVLTKHPFIGVEINESYCELAARRIENAIVLGRAGVTAARNRPMAGNGYLD